MSSISSAGDRGTQPTLQEEMATEAIKAAIDTTRPGVRTSERDGSTFIAKFPDGKRFKVVVTEVLTE